MTDVQSLRSEYAVARRDVSRADADVSQATTLLAEVESAYAASRRGDPPESMAETLDALDAEIDGWEYDADDVPTAERPTFDDFGVDSLEALRKRLVALADEGRADAFETLLSMLRTAATAAPKEFDPAVALLDELEKAFGAGDVEGVEEAVDELVRMAEKYGFSAEDLSKLLERGRGPTDRDYLVRLRSTEGRRETVEALETALEDPDADFAAARAPVAGAVRAIDAFAAARRRELADLTDRLTDQYPADAADPLDGMAGETPVLLLPTRLETRFADQPDPNGPDFLLKVRVYPDDVHVDTHERELTDAEVRWGVHFWELAWVACHTGSVEEIQAAVPPSMLDDVDLSTFPENPRERYGAVVERAWNQLEERFGPERAAWVKRELAPASAGALLDGPLETVPDVDFDALREDADRRPDSWTRAPEARTLPDQWVAFAETDGTTVTARSEPVRRPLSVGPDPDQLGEVTGDGTNASSPGDASVDAVGAGGLSWVFDFDEAVDAGMALTIPLSAAQVSAGVDSLVVLGVSTALDAAAGGHAVADLFDAHQYTDGLSLVERGTPTNDTREDSAGTPPSDDPSAYELACRIGTPGPNSGAGRAAELLGLDPDSLGGRDRHVFDGVAGATRRHAAATEAMNTALWPATWGYYLPHMLAPEAWTDDVRPRPEFLRWLEGYRRHFVSYVRAGGPVPTLRIGDQPYGILPATDLDDWRPVSEYAVDPGAELPDEEGSFAYARLTGKPVEADLAERLRAVRGTWRDAVSAVPSIESPDDAETVVTDLLAMAGTSYGYRLRDLLGEDVMTDVLGSSSAVDDATDDARAAVTKALQSSFSGARTPRVGGLLANGSAPTVESALVADDLQSYLRALRTSSHDALRAGPPGGGLSLDDAPNIVVWLLAMLFDGDDDSLLEVLLYHGLMETYRLARVRLGYHYDDFSDVEETAEKPFWDDTVWSLFPEPETYADPTLWEALDERIADSLARHPRLDARTNYGDALREVPKLDGPFAAVLNALAELESVDDPVAERSLRETLDLSSHRFDAWASSLATRRLDGMRESGGGGLYVGAYGYVENLQREPDARSAGYVHAPSVGQATTAAVLRSGYETTDEDALAVDLSADRVRDATALIDAVRNGKPLGELLGYRFERAVKENYPSVDAEQYLPALRSLAPLAEGKVSRPGMAKSDAAAEREVVDGVTLVEQWRAGSIPWGRAAGSVGTVLPSPSTDRDAYDAMTTELGALEASLDAVSAVLTAESVHQLVEGNPERAGGSLDALSRGEAPSDLDVTGTPRTGVACTHRLLAFLDSDGTTWGPSDAPRAEAEPALNDWAGGLLGDPSRAVCRVAFEPRPTTVAGSDAATDDGETTPTWRVTTVRLSALDLCPLDLVYLVEGDAEAWQSELEERIDYRVRRERSDVATDGELRISFAPPSAWPDPSALGVDPEEAIGFGPLLEAVRGIRNVVTSARAADARDVSLPGEAGARGLLKAPLVARAEAVEPRLDGAVASMDDLTAAFERPDPTAPRSEYDRLVGLVDALDGLPNGPRNTVERRFGDVDATAAGAALATLVDVARGKSVAFASDRSGTVVVDSKDPTVTGLTVARPGTTARLAVRVAGDVEEIEATVERDGTFAAKLPRDALSQLSRGDPIDVEASVGSAFSSVTARYGRSRGKLSFVDESVHELAAAAEAVGSLGARTDAVAGAAAALDADVIRTATTHLGVDHWPTAGERAELESVLGVAGATLPGFDAPEGWDVLGPVLLAVAGGRLTRDALLESDFRDVDPDPRTLERVVDELRDDVGDGLEALDDAVTAATPDASTPDPATALAIGGCEALRDALLVAADYGVHGSVPVSVTGATEDDVTALVRQANSVAAECRERLTAAGDAAADATGQRERLEALFGDAFEVLPPFEASNPGELANALTPAHEGTLLGDESLAAETWFQRVARVRDVPRDLGQLLTYGESLGDLSPADGSRFRVTQLPYEDPDTWVGRAAAWDGDPPTGKLSLVAHVRGSPDPTTLVGLFVDEFVETVPSENETTGLSFHYDKPGNRAPQTMLLAVPPTDEDWSLRTLADVVTESVDVAKLRMVDRDALDEVGHLLPAMILATNEYDGIGPDTASVDVDDLGPPWWTQGPNGGES